MALGGDGMMDYDDITMLLAAKHARFRISSRLTTHTATGYDIRPECVLFGRQEIPERVRDMLSDHGLPAQNRYTDVAHLQRLLRIFKDWRDFTKDPDGFIEVLHFLGRIPPLATHEDVLAALEVLESASV
jgi:hypothetical protein